MIDSKIHASTVDNFRPQDLILDPNIASRSLGEIIAGRRKVPISCMIHRLKADGAVLEVSSRDIPERFILRSELAGVNTLCQVVSRLETMLFVAFKTRQ